MIYRPADLGRAAFLGATGKIKVEDLERVRFALLKQPRMSMSRLSEESGLKNGSLARVVELLKDEGVITTTSRQVPTAPS